MPQATQEPAPVERRFFGVQEVATALGVTRKYIYDMMAAGDIASVKLGRRRLISAAELDRLERELIGQSDAS